MAGSKIPIKKICEYCNSEFYAHKESTRYCSHTCNSRAYKQMKREAKTRTIETAEQEKKVKDIIDRPYLKISEAGRLLGVARQTIYEHIYAGRLRASKITNRLSVVRREDIEQMLAERPYEKRQPRDAIVITELYTTEEVCDTYDISRAALFAIAKR